MLSIRPATRRDVSQIASLFDGAREFMRSTGNESQWPNCYPTEEDARIDTMRGCQFVCLDGDEIVGCLSFVPGPDTTYLKIEDGDWLNDMPYFVVHRIAAKYQGRGIGSFMMSWACQSADNVRTDTHEKNAPMRGLLESIGFKPCGTVFVEDGTPRIAYHYVRPGSKEKGGFLDWLPWRKSGLTR